MIRNELSYFFAALRFFTRLPVPAWVGHSDAQLNHAARYFPLVGLLVGLIGAVVTALALKVMPASLAIMLGMVATLLVTGAFHEDGFADTCDGFGGGWNKDQVLTIMKDSRIGSYGAVGLFMMLLFKWNALFSLFALDGWLLLPALLAAHAASRAASVTLIYALDYVRDSDGKSKPLASRMRMGELLFAWACGLAPCFLLPQQMMLQGLALMLLVTLLFATYSKHRIGGYTGDVLGATQQLAEVAFYLGCLCVFI